MQCAQCKNARSEYRYNYPVEMYGRKYIMPKALIYVCDECKKEVVSESTLENCREGLRYQRKNWEEAWILTAICLVLPIVFCFIPGLWIVGIVLSLLFGVASLAGSLLAHESDNNYIREIKQK